MKALYYDIGKKLKNALSSDMPIIALRIFGSCARDEDEYDSDIDVFVEVESLTQQAKQRIREISWLIGLDTASVISPLVFSRDELENSALRSSSIVKNIMTEGIAL